MKKFGLGELIRLLFPQWSVNLFKHLPLAILANIVYRFPSRKLTVIGVTGTDGKTTTVNMIYQILKNASKKVSMVSTINSPGLHVTSPDPFTVQRLIKDEAKEGSKYMILEVTSHGLDQFRFWGIKFEVGVITNITDEHLDYHKTFENYKNAKLKLIKNVKYAVMNANLQISRFARNDKNIITFGINKGDLNQKKLHLNLKIPGDYNIENALAAFAVSDILGIDQEKARQTLENFRGLTGRMEEIPNEKGIKIIIDFAHTPNGLENALKALDSSGKIIALIGCEGFRDVGKRSLMGEIARKLSDIVIVTAVDPRGQIDEINKQIESGAKKSGAKLNENFFIINDRKKAIKFAINNLAKKGDIVGIFGKGHEKSMNLDGKTEIPWSDKKAVMEALHG